MMRWASAQLNVGFTCTFVTFDSSHHAIFRMNELFLTFRKFNSLEEAQELMEVLKAHDIACELEDTSAFDVTFSGNALSKEYRVKLQQSDFEPAEELLLNQPHVSADQLPSDHYLLSFSDNELLEIVTKPDEWRVPPTISSLSNCLKRTVRKSVPNLLLHSRGNAIINSPNPKKTSRSGLWLDSSPLF